MIPSSRTLELAQSQVDEMIHESQEDAEEGEPYFEFEFFGLTHSYTRAGYWARILLILVLTVPILLGLVIVGEAGYALVMAIIVGGATMLSLIFLALYRR